MFRFSLRVVARSLRTATIVPTTTAQAFVAARCISTVTRVPRIAPTVFNIAQRRAFSEESSDERVRTTHRGPNGLPLTPTDTLYVGNMQFDVKEEDVKEFFAAIGEVKSVKIIYDPKGLSKG